VGLSVVTLARRPAVLVPDVGVRLVMVVLTGLVLLPLRVREMVGSGLSFRGVADTLAIGNMKR
jgi:hypothetical protein